MSPPGPANSGSDPDPSTSLQFERAEFSGGHTGPACSTCKRPAENEYHHLNGRVFCTSCRAKIEQSIDKLRQSGSLARAALFGLGAAVAGALIFYAVTAATGYEFGLIAVVVGLMVGKAVRKGSGSMGGRKYQALAMVLTYFSIASTYVPPMTKAFYAQAQKQEAAETQAFAQAAPGTPAARSKVVHIGVVPFYGFMFLLALAAPVLGGFRNILGTIILGIGLWEAWKFNRRVDVKFTGPFTVTAAQPEPGA
jgi:hypothetical protein